MGTNRMANEVCVISAVAEVPTDVNMLNRLLLSNFS